jgi:Antibiotic biosynthesis monooxygenase
VEAQRHNLADCVSVVERARRAAGCLDCAVTADLIDPGRVNIFECWESQAALDAYRGSGPSDGLAAVMLSASVADDKIADARPFFEKGSAEPEDGPVEPNDPTNEKGEPRS